ncbi:flavodoxin family protein [Candidatus Bipolaricaulota bacterium]
MGTSAAILYSSSPNSGNTARLLKAFMKGLERGGDDTKIFDVKEIQPSPCTGELHCWFKDPGNCYIDDGMQDLYPVLRKADTLVLGTPVYIPLPGEMQNLLNRLCPIVEPELETRDGRTRGRMRGGVGIQRIALVATSGWWEIENMDTVVRIARELAEDASVPLAGPLLRPHAAMALSPQGKPSEILQAAEQAGFELASTGKIRAETLSTVSQPLIGQEEYRQYMNQMRAGASK